MGKPDHVLVLVHGMGPELKGGTLQEWAQPFLQSLNDIALDHRDALPRGSLFHDYPALIVDAADAVSDAPTTWVRVLKAHPVVGDEYLDLVITEASWGNDFIPATVRATYDWSWGVMVTVVRRAARMVWWNMYPRAHAGLWGWILRRLRDGAMALICAVAFPAIILGMILLALAILGTPIPAVGRLVGKLLTAFADFLGDPATWQRKQMQAAAMRQRVAETIERWPDDHLATTAKPTRVSVLAHSQGAAISAQVLLQGRVAASNFICVGNGLPLLGYARWGGRSQAGGTTMAPKRNPVQDWLECSPGLRWINLWAKFDFVPAGPVASDAGANNTEAFRELYGRSPEESPGPEEHPIYNSSALIKDHIVYSQNRIEVIDPVAQLIYIAADQPATTPGQLWLPPLTVPRNSLVPALQTRVKVHRLLVRCLGMARLLAFISGAIMVVPLLAKVTAWPWVGRLTFCKITALNNQIVLWPCTQAPEWHRPGDWWILIVGIIVLGCLTQQVVNGWIWGMLHGRVERRRTLMGAHVPQAGFGALVCYLACVLLLAVALPLAVVELLSAHPATVSGAGLAWAAGYVALAIALTVLSLVGRPIAARPARRNPPA
ncbi:hypothetical protein AL755_10970 [Arthrobacter sp. ERGS1:01]|uniref:hypothetical protein n=1 Tax=Arthrobacter sp. ERGS1:01 TaxID=1704044 RepID=UPI0006B6389E|nr:hypothetical protein [Arthrobacter sp. ERGS1:01]ALE05870.1 hypothetical protein AL755_10970 [Arthrobacter sp. ERGS1:01]